MTIEKLQAVLEDTFAANFVAYYRSHVAHVNITGPNFYSDHKFLQKVYEDLQGNIDTLGELLRTIKAEMPKSVSSVIAISPFLDDEVDGDCEELLRLVLADQERMIDQYKELNEAATAVDYIDIANYAQGRVGDHAKFRWMLESILEQY